MRQKLIFWLPVALVTTVVCGLVYAAAQQNLRMAANDPQIQMSEDAAQQLAAGQSVASILPTQTVEISQSLAPFILVFNEAGQLVGANGKLDGQAPTLPMGIFTYTQAHQQDRLTWQPRVGVRSAIVVTGYTGNNGSGFVVAGRSLREIETREAQLLILVGLAWIVAIVGSLGMIAISSVLTLIRHLHSKSPLPSSA